MFGRKKKIEELERRIEVLEKRFNEAFGVRDAEASSPTRQKRDNEAVAMAQVMDEWLNGKKEGGK